MNDRSRGNLSPKEISLIKAMWNLGKPHGFHGQKIQSYFSRPNRTLNPARFYEIRDGKLGAEIPAASDTQLQEFLFETERRLGIIDEPAASVTPLPPYMYIGIRDGLITVLSREEVFADDDFDRRTLDKLIEAQAIIALELVDEFRKTNVDPRICDDFSDYAELAEQIEGPTNIFLLHRRFTILQHMVAIDKDAIGDRSYTTWQIFEQNHTALCALYPEMQSYIAALPQADKSTQFPMEVAAQARAEMVGEKAEKVIDPLIGDLLEENIRSLREGPDGTSTKEEKLNITSIVGRVSSFLYAGTKILPTLNQNIESAEKIRDKLLPLAKSLSDWLNIP